MKSKSEVEKIVCDGVVETFDLKEDITNINMSFKDDLEADSIDMVSLALVLEDEFGSEVEEDKLKDFKTIANVIDYIMENQEDA